MRKSALLTERAHSTSTARTVAFRGANNPNVANVMVSQHRSPQALMEPAVRPCTMYFWKISTSRTAGRAPRKPEAAMTE